MKAEAEVGMASYFYFFMAHLRLRSLGEFDRCDADYSREPLPKNWTGGIGAF